MKSYLDEMERTKKLFNKKTLSEEKFDTFLETVSQSVEDAMLVFDTAMQTLKDNAPKTTTPSPRPETKDCKDDAPAWLKHRELLKTSSLSSPKNSRGHGRSASTWVPPSKPRQLENGDQVQKKNTHCRRSASALPLLCH